MKAAQNLGHHVGIKAACEALQVPRATFYRRMKAKDTPIISDSRVSPPLALSTEERQGVVDILHSERFVDKAPTPDICYPSGRGQVPLFDLFSDFQTIYSLDWFYIVASHLK